jgi:hypothetical protein
MPAVNSLAPIYADDKGGDDDLYVPRLLPKKDMRSKLIRSKEKAAGLIVNACPFGCSDEELDAEAYCEHLVGFTDPSNDRVFYPLKWRESVDGRGRVVKRFRYVDGDDRQMVEKGDQLVRVTTSARVYRELPIADPEPEVRIGTGTPKPSAGDAADLPDNPAQ